MIVNRQALSRPITRTSLRRSKIALIVIGLVAALWMIVAAVANQHSNDGRELQHQMTQNGTQILAQREDPEWKAPTDRQSPGHPNNHSVIDSNDPFTLPQSDWRDWLANHTVTKSYTPRGGTLEESSSSCSLSMRMRMKPDNLVFFKYAFAGNIDHKAAESHLREIKAAYLDRILGTGVVLPCTGMVLDRKKVFETFPGKRQPEYQGIFAGNTHCETDDDRNSFKGSMMYYMEGVNRTKIDKVMTTALISLPRLESPRDETHDSAVSYAVFLYLAGCMKTPHNHFHVNLTRFVAIDNDRCFVPVRVMNGTNVPQDWYDLFGAWARLVFEICDFPYPLLETLRNARAGVKLSERLRMALAEDVLADDLLSEQPQALQEVDARAEKLLQHMESESCRQRQRWGP